MITFQLIKKSSSLFVIPQCHMLNLIDLFKFLDIYKTSAVISFCGGILQVLVITV